MRTIAIVIPVTVPDTIDPTDVPGYINRFIDTGLDDADDVARETDDYNPEAVAEAIKATSLDIGEPEIFCAPRVLITVTGGVVEYNSMGEVDVALIDYDNEPEAEPPAGFEDLL